VSAAPGERGRIAGWTYFVFEACGDSRTAYFGWGTMPWRAATGRFTTLHRAKAATTAELQICRTRG
jgi:hypothetical protein